MTPSLAVVSMWELPGEPPTPILRGHKAAAAFDKAILFLDKAVKKKIKYYKVPLAPLLADLCAARAATWRSPLPLALACLAAGGRW
jgi:hypothetical protein